MKVTDQEVLAAALLWLRNHYDIGDPKLKRKVLNRIDRVLKNHEPSAVAMVELRKRYP